MWTDDATAMASAVVAWSSWAIGGSAGWPAPRPQPHAGARSRLPAGGRRRRPVRHDPARRLLRRGRRTRDPRSLAPARAPTAIVFDNDLMAIAGLSALAELGIAVPHEVSLLAWDDSALCDHHPPEAVRPEPRRDGVRRPCRPPAVRPARGGGARGPPRLHPAPGGAPEHGAGAALTSGGRSGRAGRCGVGSPSSSRARNTPAAVATGKTTTATNGTESSRKHGTPSPRLASGGAAGSRRRPSVSTPRVRAGADQLGDQHPAAEQRPTTAAGWPTTGTKPRRRAPAPRPPRREQADRLPDRPRQRPAQRFLEAGGAPGTPGRPPR